MTPHLKFEKKNQWVAREVSTGPTPCSCSLAPILCVHARRHPNPLLCGIRPELRTEMRVSGLKGRVLTLLDAIKQALLLFNHAMLMMCTDHRFAFSYLGSSIFFERYVCCFDVINRVLTSLIKLLLSDNKEQNEN